jgi:hypothetical protein
VGLENTIRTIIVPTILLLRFGRSQFSTLIRQPLGLLWLLLTAYAAVACLWSPFQLSGLKMVAYLVSYLMIGAIFLEAWKRGHLSPHLVAVALWASLGMAAIQTYVLGNPYGVSDLGLRDERFTSFCAPQQFGAFLLSAVAVLLVTSRLSATATLIHAAGGFTGIALCGSRYVFLGALLLLPVVWLSHIVRQRTAPARTLRIIGGAAALGAAGTALAVFTVFQPGNRINQLILDNIGTLVWRKGIYTQAWTALERRAPGEWITGSGTSSGASVVLGWDRRYFEDRIDANRVVHNELIRVVYEWGLIGLVLFLAAGVVLIRWLISAVRCRVIPAYAFAAMLPTMILGCLSENILAGAASPGGVGFSLVLFYGVSYRPLAGAGASSHAGNRRC